MFISLYNLIEMMMISSGYRSQIELERKMNSFNDGYYYDFQHLNATITGYNPYGTYMECLEKCFELEKGTLVKYVEGRRERENLKYDASRELMDKYFEETGKNLFKNKKKIVTRIDKERIRQKSLIRLKAADGLEHNVYGNILKNKHRAKEQNIGNIKQTINQRRWKK